MTDDFRDNYSSHSIDVIRRRPNKNLEIILEENNSINHDNNNPEMSESKTQDNFYINNSPLHETSSGKRFNSSEKKKRSEILHQKVKQILDYRAKINALKPEEDSLEKEIKNEEDASNKKKVPKKVNRNLNLLNLIKERMSQTENKEDKKDEKKIENNNIKIEEKEENKKIEENKNVEENKEIKKEENVKEAAPTNIEKMDDNKNVKENDTNEQKIKEEERKQKLMKLLDKKKYTKRPKKENEFEKKEDKNKNNIPHPHTNVGSVSYPTFMKKGMGNFRINTPKSKNKIKNEKDKDEQNEEENKKEKESIKEDKSSEIPIEQKYKLTINISPKNIPSIEDNNNNNPNLEDKNVDDKNENNNDNKKIIDLSDKKEENNNLKEDIKKYESNKKEEINTENKSNDNSSSKKGAMKILELLKAKKKEQNENLMKTQSEKSKNKTSNKKKEDDDNEDEEEKEKDINSPNIYNQRKTEGDKQRSGRNSSEGKFDINSLPKKTFRDEEDDEENNYNLYEPHNRTSQQFKNNKKANYNKIKVNENMNKKKHYINNINNINNNINNFFNLNNPPNYQERKTVNYINNANKIRNKFNKNMNNYNSLNQTEKNSPKSYFDQKNSFIKKNVKTLDNSFDVINSRKKFMVKRINNKNYNSININSKKNIYEPKKISNNNSPIRYMPPLRNTINNLNSTKNIKNEKIYNKINNKRNTAYVKKSPGRMKEFKNNNNLGGDSKKIIRNIYNMNNKNKNIGKIYSNVDNTNNNIGSFEVSSIYGLNSSTDTYTTNRFDYINTNYNNYFYNNNSLENDKKGNSVIFNLEDLMVLEERLNDITFALESNKNIERQCLNFFNYYYNCSLYQLLEKIFPNEEDSNTIRLSINYELMSIIVCYEYSFQIEVYDEDLCLSLLELIFFNHSNLMIICEYILKKISPENKGNVWALKLQEMVNNAKMAQSKDLKNSYPSSPINKIKYNTKTLINKLKNILLNCKSEFSQIIYNYLKNIEIVTYEEINNFFRNFILRENNFEGSIVASSYLKKIKNFSPFPAPYITEPSEKPYTLILDLDETLVSFKIKSKKEGTLRARPFLFGFLEEMGHYYELIVWTSATEAYANSLIDAIEIEKQYFDYVLFREHAIIIGDDFVKDLNRVGRSLDRVIIVDDMPQNFRLQKQNGITIKPFLGDDYNDTALYDLIPILKHIAEEGKDVRVGLEKYRDEIVRKVTSNISKQNY